MDYRRFEKEFLRLAFTTTAELTPASMAFFTGITIDEAERHMQRLVSHGVLELGSDEEGHIKYVMPDRPAEPYTPVQHAVMTGAPVPYPDPPTIAPPRAIVVRDQSRALVAEVTPGQAVASMFLNAMVCPGIGSLVGGKTRAGIAQLSLFLVGLPLVVVAIGLPMIVAAWTWGIATGAQLIAEARNP